MDTRSSPMFPFTASRFRRRVARVSQHLNDLHSTIAAIEEREYSLMTAIQHFAEVADSEVVSKRSGKRPKAYLSFCSPARLLRHTSRHRERTITIPIMATPSFMPNQMESNVSTVHHLSQRAARQFVPDAQSPVEHLNHEGPFWKKRWYLAVSVNGCSAAFESLRTLAPSLLQAAATGSPQSDGIGSEPSRGRRGPQHCRTYPLRAMNVGSENGPGWSQARKRTCRAEVLRSPG
jgi:hypothetical protein